jgi:hypothetical protein
MGTWKKGMAIGQILTYMAGLESSTMIWIAEKFTEEQISTERKNNIRRNKRKIKD